MTHDVLQHLRKLNTLYEIFQKRLIQRAARAPANSTVTNVIALLMECNDDAIACFANVTVRHARRRSLVRHTATHV